MPPHRGEARPGAPGRAPRKRRQNLPSHASTRQRTRRVQRRRSRTRGQFVRPPLRARPNPLPPLRRVGARASQQRQGAGSPRARPPNAHQRRLVEPRAYPRRRGRPGGGCSLHTQRGHRQGVLQRQLRVHSQGSGIVRAWSHASGTRVVSTRSRSACVVHPHHSASTNRCTSDCPSDPVTLRRYTPAAVAPGFHRSIAAPPATSVWAKRWTRRTTTSYTAA